MHSTYVETLQRQPNLPIPSRHPGQLTRQLGRQAAQSEARTVMRLQDVQSEALVTIEKMRLLAPMGLEVMSSYRNLTAIAAAMADGDPADLACLTAIAGRFTLAQCDLADDLVARFRQEGR